MRNKIFRYTCMAMISAITLGLVGCPDQGTTDQGTDQGTDPGSKPKPLNISIFLDLSDRISKTSSNMPQHEKDTAIINELTNAFVDTLWRKNINYAKGSFKVFFHPVPPEANINEKAKILDVDFARDFKLKSLERQTKAKAFREEVQTNIGDIYQTTLNTHKWIGSDIWGFFANKASQLCIKKDYRNILVIITDGYIYYAPSNSANAQDANYISGETLAKGLKLTECQGCDLKDLEVLVLEVNANPTNDLPKMKTVWENWFQSMGITHYMVCDCDMPNNVKTFIKNFMDSKP